MNMFKSVPQTFQFSHPRKAQQKVETVEGCVTVKTLCFLIRSSFWVCAKEQRCQSTTASQLFLLKI